ncbi:glycosyl transferase family 2 [Candidatus Wolfebacteria bacterium]|nr:MAG: glycosyl transferase family 2 [Candidatus Wolfebacteria bacterium]
MKFTIVTPTYNGGEYIRETIESVLSQSGDFKIEYIIIDGGSTDNTTEIIKEYEQKLENNTISIKCDGIEFKWISEKDNGMYSAINKGFDMATGDIYAWINSDDKYLTNAFQIMKNVFEKYPDIDWAKGKTIFIDKNAQNINTAPCFIFNKKWIELGIYGRYAYFINQDSVFWRKKLWNKSGKIDDSLRYAGDYDLWCKFAKQTSLWSIDALVSVFRQKDGQLSENMSGYRREQSKVKESGGFLQKKVMLFFFIKNRLDPKNNSLILHYLYRILFRNHMKQYITINEDGKPYKSLSCSYISTCKQNKE